MGAEAGASVQATLTAGRLVAGSGVGGGGGSAGFAKGLAVPWPLYLPGEGAVGAARPGCWFPIHLWPRRCPVPIQPQLSPREERS